MKLLFDEHQHKGDRIQIPGLHQDGGHHEPTDPGAFWIVARDEVTDRGIHGRLMSRRARHGGHASLRRITRSERSNTEGSRSVPRPGPSIGYTKPPRIGGGAVTSSRYQPV